MKYFIGKNITLLFALFVASAFAGGDIQAGAARGAAICSSCHGKWIAIHPEWPKIAGQGEKYLLKQLRDYRSGKRNNRDMMAQTAMLDGKEIADIAAWFAAQKPFSATDKQTTETEPDEPGKVLYHQGDTQAGLLACASCHGGDGAGNAESAVPRLAGQHAAYIRDQLHKFRNAMEKETQRPPRELRDNDPGGMMRTIAGRLSDAQIDALALYIEGIR